MGERLMADIFISYARADRGKIEKLAAALEDKGYSVWWDRNIVGGSEFSEEIEKELTAAKAVIVAWSEDSVKSRWVRDEAGHAAEAGKLIPIGLDGSHAPMGFKQLHVIDLEDWNGKPDGAGFADVSRALATQLTGTAPDPVTPEKQGWFARFSKKKKKKKEETPLNKAINGMIIVAIVFITIEFSGPDNGFFKKTPERTEESAGSTPVNNNVPVSTPVTDQPQLDGASIACLLYTSPSPRDS